MINEVSLPQNSLPRCYTYDPWRFTAKTRNLFLYFRFSKDSVSFAGFGKRSLIGCEPCHVSPTFLNLKNESTSDSLWQDPWTKATEMKASASYFRSTRSSCFPGSECFSPSARRTCRCRCRTGSKPESVWTSMQSLKSAPLGTKFANRFKFWRKEK